MNQRQAIISLRVIPSVLYCHAARLQVIPVTEFCKPKTKLEVKYIGLSTFSDNHRPPALFLCLLNLELFDGTSDA